MRKIAFLTCLAIVCVSIFFASCNSKKQESKTIEQKDNDSASLKVALVPISSTLPFYIAQEVGIYDSLGADIKLVRYDAAINADTAFAHGSVDGMSTDVVKAIIMSKNTELGLVMALDNKYSLITPHDLRLKSVADLKERIIAMTRNSAPDYVLDKMLATAKYGTEDANKAQINALPIRLQMLLNSQVDAALMPEPYSQLAAIAGNRTVCTSTDLGISTDVMAFKKTAMIKKENQIRLLIQGYNLAVKYMKDNNYSKWKKFAAKHYGMQQKVADTLKIECDEAKAPMQKDLEAPIEWLKQRKLISKDAAMPHLIEVKFLNQQPK